MKSDAKDFARHLKASIPEETLRRFLALESPHIEDVIEAVVSFAKLKQKEAVIEFTDAVASGRNNSNPKAGSKDKTSADGISAFLDDLAELG